MSLENKILELSKKTEIKNIIHIGAHLGNEIDFYAKLNPDNIYWFEANPELISDLEKNVMRYSYINQKIFNYAVSKDNGKIKFNLFYSDDMTNTGCSSLFELKHHQIQYPHIKKIKEIYVDSINIDDFLISNNLITEFDLVNMDVQGSEYDILSTSDILYNKTEKDQFFILETSSDELYEGQKNENDIINIMNYKGYKRIFYNPMAHNWGDSLFSKK